MSQDILALICTAGGTGGLSAIFISNNGLYQLNSCKTKPHCGSTLILRGKAWLSLQVSFHPSHHLPQQTGRTSSAWALALSTRAATNKKLWTQS